MKKIDLGLDFEGIRKRIETDMSPFKPKKWAELIGLSPQNISNVHGKARKNLPSLQYVIAVARFTGKPIAWYLYGERAPEALAAEPRPEYGAGKGEFGCGWPEEIKELCKKVKDILESGRPVIVRALKSNIEAFEDSVKQEELVRKLKATVNHHTRLLEADRASGTGKDTGTDSRTKKM